MSTIDYNLWLATHSQKLFDFLLVLIQRLLLRKFKCRSWCLYLIRLLNEAAERVCAIVRTNALRLRPSLKQRFAFLALLPLSQQGLRTAQELTLFSLKLPIRTVNRRCMQIINYSRVRTNHYLQHVVRRRAIACSVASKQPIPRHEFD